MKKSRKEKDFLDLPKFTGGKKAFRIFIAENMKYPKEALENKIEGNVLISFQVNDLGEVTDANVVKGLDYGCDEEALRLIKLARFQKTRKQGVRIKSTFRTKISFNLPTQNKLAYQYNKKENKENKTKGKTSYSYSINIKKRN